MKTWLHFVRTTVVLWFLCGVLQGAETVFPRESWWIVRYALNAGGSAGILLSLSSAEERASANVPGLVPEELSAKPKEAWELTFHQLQLSRDAVAMSRFSVYATIHDGEMVVRDGAWTAKYRYTADAEGFEITLLSLKGPEEFFPAWATHFPSTVGEKRRFKHCSEEMRTELKTELRQRLDNQLP